MNFKKCITVNQDVPTSNTDGQKEKYHMSKVIFIIIISWCLNRITLYIPLVCIFYSYISYRFAGDHTPLEEKNITKYINHFNKILSGCIKLRPRTPNSEEYYVRIIKGSGCTSFFGNFEHRPNQGNYQNLSLGIQY